MLATMIGGPEILVIAGVIVLLFGASQIPKVARSLGQGIRELKKGMKEDTPDHEEHDEKKDNGGKTES
jgi:sec-independent protein translocase protein TatA